MVGVKGKSGRKPNPESKYERNSKVTFYVKEYARTNANGNIVEWVKSHDFVWFKRHHGARWMDQIRAWMRQDVRAWKTDHHWTCKCPPSIYVPSNKRHNRIDKCHKCGEYKNQITRRIYERV